MIKTLTNSYIRFIQKFLPSPFTIAFGLTGICIVLALLFTKPNEVGVASYSLTIFDYWGKGVWGLLEFTAQMMLILVLGHAIALSRPALHLINRLMSLCTSNSKAAFVVTLFTVLSGYINWGLGLIFGAILARQVFEYSKDKNISINYPLIGACGYTGMMVWHAGLSGSAPLTVAQSGHSLVSQMGVLPLSETLFSSMNITVIISTIIVLPILAYLLGKSKTEKHNIEELALHNSGQLEPEQGAIFGAERLDHKSLIGYFVGSMIVMYWLYSFFSNPNPLNYLGLNTINLLFFGLALLSHGTIYSFLKAIDQGIKGASGILIQFPLYAGIMGIMAHSGLLTLSAQFLVDQATAATFPLFGFMSSALVNILIPSGGGQWQIQGPILIEAAQNLQVSLGKTTMCLAYGDQLTNMLQPFWALPLLSITQLKAKDILPYSLIFMFAGIIIYGMCLLIF
jgi:short-chain fatty acids transporter